MRTSKRARVHRLSGYGQLQGTTTKGSTTTASSSGGFGVADGITAGTNLFTSIFNPLVAKKSETELAKLSNQRAETNTLLAQAQTSMMNAQTEAEKVRLQQQITALEQAQFQMDDRAQNLAVLSQTQKASITPLGYGAIAGALGLTVFAVAKLVK